MTWTAFSVQNFDQPVFIGLGGIPPLSWALRLVEYHYPTFMSSTLASSISPFLFRRKVGYMWQLKGCKDIRDGVIQLFNAVLPGLHLAPCFQIYCKIVHLLQCSFYQNFLFINLVAYHCHKRILLFSKTYAETYSCTYMLNMELDLQSLFGLRVHSCTHWLRPRNPPPRIWAHIRGRYSSAKTDYISLWPLCLYSSQRKRVFLNILYMMLLLAVFQWTRRTYRML
jgi:hypothetical protein